MNKKIFSQIKISIIAIGLIFGMNAFAVPQVDPSSFTPNTGNTATPLYTNTIASIKTGGLSVNAFSAYKNAMFAKKVTITGALLAESGNVLFGGDANDGNGVRTVNVSTSGTTTTKAIAADNVKTNSVFNALCADPSGKVLLCDQLGCTINSFTANPTSIVGGTPTTLSYSTDRCSSGSIDHGVATLTGSTITSGTKSVSPIATTTYTLTATDGNVTKTATATVTVTPSACSNIGGVTNSDIGTAYELESDGTCKTIIQTSMNINVNGYYRNLANNAWLGYITLTDLHVTSVGKTTTTTWPSTSDLVFRWAICGKWNGAYSGPNILETQASQPSQGGVCVYIPPTLGDNTLPYPTFDSNNYPTYDESTNEWVGLSATHGLYDYLQHSTFGSYTTPGDITEGYSQQNASHGQLVEPFDRIEIWGLTVPSGYVVRINSANGIPIKIYP